MLLLCLSFASSIDLLRMHFGHAIQQRVAAIQPTLVWRLNQMIKKLSSGGQLYP